MNELSLNTFPEEWVKPNSFTNVNGNAGLQQAIFGADAELSVRFVMFPEINEFETEKVGHKVIEYKEYVRIQRLGDKSTIYFQPAKPGDKARFALQYQLFKSGKEERIGIPLEAWDYQLSETDILTFKLLGVEYVHQLAAMNETQQASLGIDSKKIVARAKITVSELSEKEAAAALQAKFDEQAKRMDALEEENQKLMALMQIKEKEAIERAAKDGAIFGVDAPVKRTRKTETV